MIYLYKRNKTGICIDRVYGYDTIVELPDMLKGFPVTELGAYIFSDHIDSTELKMMQEKENFCTENGRATRPEDDMPQAAGNRVEEIRLPRQLRKIGRYAFYNCFHLKKLTFYGKMQDLGAGALTGCHRMEQIAVETDEKGESSLRDFLTELPETLCVDITIDGEYGRFWFPEFFEEGVENTPPGSWKIMCMEAEFVIETVSYIKRSIRWNTTGYFHMQLLGTGADRIESGTGPNSLSGKHDR